MEPVTAARRRRHDPILAASRIISAIGSIGSTQTQAEQPHWMTPVATTTPRLEEEFRYDQFFEKLGNGGTLDNFDGGKGKSSTTNSTAASRPRRMSRLIVGRTARYIEKCGARQIDPV